MKNAIAFALALLAGTAALAENTLSIAMIFREQDAPLDAARLKGEVESEFSAALAETPSGTKGVMMFPVNDFQIVVARLPAGIPVEELESALRNSLLFQDPGAAIARQKAHIIVTVISPGNDKIQNRLSLTKAVRAVLLCAQALGVYWGDASQIIQPDMFLELTKNCGAGYLPIPIWISLCPFKNESGGLDVHSIGLKALDFPEYEIIDLRMPWNEAFFYLLDLAQDILSSGKRVNDSETVGRDENEKLKVRYLKSKITDDERVMRIYM